MTKYIALLDGEPGNYRPLNSRLFWLRVDG
jgi:hypothetical protein